MAITFNTNLAALGAQRNIGIASNAASSSLSKLSSGSRVPQAKDDAAGLAIGSKLKSEVTGLTQASNNAAQAISLLQIADGALSSVGDMLQRMKALAVQSSSGQLADADRSLLNQEFTSLRSEIDRVAALANFNGTTLLAGSTTTEATANTLAGYDATNSTAAANVLVGIESYDFTDGFGDGAIKVEYAATGRLLTVTNLENDQTQTIALGATAISAGSTEEYNFGDIGVKLTLNSQFNKAADLAGTNSANVNAAASSVEASVDDVTLNLTGVTATTVTINSYSFTGTGANEFFVDQLYGATSAVSSTDETDVTLANITIGTHTFVNTTGPQTFATAGNIDYTFDDGQGNTFVLRLATTGNATGGAASATLTIDSAATQGTAGKIEATGTGVNAPNVSAVVVDNTNPFNFGNVDDAELEIDGTTASAAAASITLNGVAFSTATGGATADLTSTGIKTITLGDGNGNSFSVQFNVTQAFNNGDDAQITLGEFGQLVGVSSITSGSTSFAFKVGTGTTANDSISFSLTSATTTSLGIGASTIDTAANADLAIAAVNSAITAVSSRRADIGAAQSRLDFASTSISVSIENTTAAQSALLDVDVSAEITTFTNKNVLMQAGISLLGQANQQPALLLRLLQ